MIEVVVPLLAGGYQINARDAVRSHTEAERVPRDTQGGALEIRGLVGGIGIDEPEEIVSRSGGDGRERAELLLRILDSVVVNDFELDAEDRNDR
ncbi:MAG: hypothetical protein ACOCXN_10375 [Spirochaetota bacterium]